MDGITILSSSINTEFTPGFGIGIVLIGTIMVILIIIGIVSSIFYHNPCYLVIGGISCLLLFPFILMFYSFEGKPNEYTVYRVVIDDSVSYNDFNKKYEILSQDGLIYTVKERVDSN